MATSKLRVTELDFDTIKANLKDFFKGQTEFTDYDFDGSGLSLLLDVLAYNTHYMSYYLNMVANESFLDSATQRDSVVSLAKNLGYTPRSRTGASAVLSLAITQNSTQLPDLVKIPAYTQFNVTSLGKSYTFYSLVDKIITWDGSATGNNRTFAVTDFKVTQGAKLIKEFVVTGNENQRFLLENTNVDSSTVSVRVKENTSSNTFDTYSKFDGLLALDSSSTYYFVNEAEGGSYEISFGDGVYGKKVSAGNVIVVDYLTTDGPDANGLTGLTLSSESQTWGETSNQTSASVSVAVTTTSSSSGGSEPESLDSIKYLAPRSFQHQNRAVTADDYKAIITSKYSNASSVRVWGGDEDSSAGFGKIFIAIKPQSKETLTENEKNEVRNILKDYKIVGMETIIKSPEYVGLKVDSIVKYNPSLTSKESETLKLNAINAIKEWNLNKLNKFDGVFRYSQLGAAIDNSDKAILSNTTEISLIKTTPELTTLAGYYAYDQTKNEDTTKIFYNYSSGSGSIPVVTLFDKTVYLKDSKTDRNGVEDRELITIKRGGFTSSTFTVLGFEVGDDNSSVTTTDVDKHRLLTVKIVDVPDLTKENEGTLKIVTVDDKDVRLPGYIDYREEKWDSTIGKIKYDKGELYEWKQFPVASLEDKITIDLIGKVGAVDVIPEGNQILSIKDSHINVSMDMDKDS